MNLKQLLTRAAVVAMLVSTATFATAAAPDAGAKFRGDYSGRWQSGTSRSRMMYRAPAPVVIRSEAVPSTVTQTPTERRSFSAEPSQPAAPPAPTGCHGGYGFSAEPSQPATPQTQAAQPAPRVYRSYSYQPQPSTAPYRSYRAPMTRSYRGSAFPDAGAKFRGDFR
ncbi:MAG: hypothetical protein HY000_14065 [Planctomycetes bacterium]|nr:hypothetical protein [Planctomycetota bacterium]